MFQDRRQHCPMSISLARLRKSIHLLHKIKKCSIATISNSLPDWIQWMCNAGYSAREFISWTAEEYAVAHATHVWGVIEWLAPILAISITNTDKYSRTAVAKPRPLWPTFLKNVRKRSTRPFPTTLRITIVCWPRWLISHIISGNTVIFCGLDFLNNIM